MENDDIHWDKITDSKNAKCIKIDHESMMKWKNQFDSVQKPMKMSFKAPEVMIYKYMYIYYLYMMYILNDKGEQKK